MGITNEKSLSNIQDIENMIDDRGNWKWFDLDRDVSEEQTNCILRSIEKAPFKAYPFYDQPDVKVKYPINHSDYLKIALTNSEQGRLIKQHIWANISTVYDNTVTTYSINDIARYKNFVDEKYKWIFNHRKNLQSRPNTQLFAPLVVLYFHKAPGWKEGKAQWNDGPSCSKGVNIGVMATSAIWCGMTMGLHNTFCGCINHDGDHDLALEELNRLVGISNDYVLGLMTCHGYSYYKDDNDLILKRVKYKREKSLGPSIHTKIKKY